MDLLVADAVGLVQRVDQALCDAMHVVGMAQPLQHDDELVTAQPTGCLRLRLRLRLRLGLGVRLKVRLDVLVCRRLRQRPAHRIAAAHGAVQAAGHQAQQLVADGGAKRVGDAAEAVAVDEQHREFAVRVGTGLVQRLGDVFDDDGAVRQRRQRVSASVRDRSRRCDAMRCCSCSTACVTSLRLAISD